MTRKLLPYEYDLIGALGVTKDEYLDFVAQQHVHEDIKDGSVLDVRNDTTAIILFVVGVLLQVASVLLMPKPPELEGTAQKRDQRIGRRTGFNGTQELASYGDAVPLVYTNTKTNAYGGVRVSTLLLWSAVLSFGNHQFMRLMMTIGASSIGSIDPERTAIGQFAARDLVLSNVWQYFNPNGPTRYRDLLPVGSLDAKDPTQDERNDTTARIAFGDDLSSQQGFSQAFSPTTSDKVGVTGFIPVNAQVMILTPKGEREFKLVDVELTGRGNFWGNNLNRPTVPVGTALRLIIGDTSKALMSDDTAGIAAQDAQRAASSIVDNGAVFKAGSAKFRVRGAKYDGDGNIEDSKLTVDLVCIQKGKMPRLEYNIRHWLETGGTEQQEINKKIAELDKKVDDNKSAIKSKQEILDRGWKLVRVVNSEGKYDFVRKQLTKQDRATIQQEIEQLENKNTRLTRQIEDLTAASAALAVAPFHTKGFARIEEAAYASVTSCNVLDLALRFQVFRRLSGRSNVYGSKQKDYGHSPSDNGAKARTAMFVVYYTLNSGTENYIPYIFCCRGFNEQDVFTYLKLRTPGTPKQFEVRLEPVVDPYTEVRTLTIKGYCYLDPGAKATTLNTTRTGNNKLTVHFNGVRREPNDKDYPPLNKNPRDVSEFDLFNYDAYSTSSFAFDNGPEIQITAVNEQVLEAWDSPNNANHDRIYRGLSNFALHVVSGAGTRDLRSVSVWVNQGKRVRTLNEDGTYTTDKPKSSSFAPEIFLDTVLDNDNGIGEYAKVHAVDVQQLGLSKRFCRVNNLYMDGVIADQRSWRQFWSEVAPFSLLELGKIGGRDTLVPALPYDEATGHIRDTQPILISALFNQGNILEGSLKEEFIDYGASTQDVIVTVLYRDVERTDLFPRNDSVEIRLTSTEEGDAIRETIDASQFVTRRDQAIKLGKFLCNTRRHSRRAIEFQTFPTDTFVMPGSFVYVETSNNQWDGIYTGRVEAGGALNLPIASTVPNGTYNVLTYGSTEGTRSFSGITVSNNTATALASVEGQLFVLGTAVRSKRVFRVTEVNMEEEGETTLRAVEHSCNSNGLSLIARGIDGTVAGLFTIDGSAE